MSKNTLLRQLLIDEEGFDTKAYQDSEGIWTIGVGHNLEIDQRPEELEAMGLPLDWDIDDIPEHERQNIQITEAQAYALFDIDVEDALEDIASTFTEQDLDALGETRRAVVLSMVFQCGGKGFRAFKNCIAAIRAEDWTTASVEMLDSKVAKKQSPARWQRASNAIRDGFFEKYNKPKDISLSVDVNTLADNNPLANVSNEKLIAELSRRLGANL